jgi:hypothetical protein
VGGEEGEGEEDCSARAGAGTGTETHQNKDDFHTCLPFQTLRNDRINHDFTYEN